MNDDESTYEVPDYILSRLQPALEIGFPNRSDEMAIMRCHLPFAEEELLNLTVDFLQRAHDLDLDFSPRDGTTMVRYALKRLSQQEGHPVATDAAWSEALDRVLGSEAADLERLADQRRQALGDRTAPMGLEDFFFADEDPLNPGRDDKYRARAARDRRGRCTLGPELRVGRCAAVGGRVIGRVWKPDSLMHTADQAYRCR